MPGPHAPATPQICLKERGLIQRLEARCDPLEADEAVLELLTLLFPFTRIVHERLSESHVRLVERVKRVFRRVTGTTIHEYQNQLRLRESLSRVLRGDDLHYSLHRDAATPASLVDSAACMQPARRAPRR